MDVSQTLPITNNDFHNTGVPAAPGLSEDMGRTGGIEQVFADEFNCLRLYSDAAPEAYVELRFPVNGGDGLKRQYKPPSPRNVANRGPHMYASQLAMEDVPHHYKTAPGAPVGRGELEPLHLAEGQIAHLLAFLKMLDSPMDAEPRWLTAPAA